MHLRNFPQHLQFLQENDLNLLDKTNQNLFEMVIKKLWHFLVGVPKFEIAGQLNFESFVNGGHNICLAKILSLFIFTVEKFHDFLHFTFSTYSVRSLCLIWLWGLFVPFVWGESLFNLIFFNNELLIMSHNQTLSMGPRQSVRESSCKPLLP